MLDSSMGAKSGHGLLLWLRPLQLLALLGSLGLFGSCFDQSGLRNLPRMGGHRAHPKRMTVVVAIDGVRWQEVFQGVDRARARRLGLAATEGAALMPHLHELIDQSGCAVGAPGSQHTISASGPNFVSLPGYTEIFTGAAPTECHDNDCQRVRRRTVADVAADLDPHLGHVAVITSWPKLELAASTAPGRIVVSAGRTHGTNHRVFGRHESTHSAYERGRRASPAPGWGDFRPDRYTAELALSYLTDDQPSFLFVGLGETDEYAHQNDYRNYLAALRNADETIAAVYDILRQAEGEGISTLLLVTSDHGRARFVHHGAEYPESARTWLVAAGSSVTARGEVSSPAPRKLADLAPTIRWFWGLAPASSASDDATDTAEGVVLTELL